MKINFIKQNKASFIRDWCCHVTLSVHLIEPNLNDALSDEFDASVATLQSAAASLNADCVMLRERVASADETEHQQQDQKVVKKTGQFLVRQRAEEKVSFLRISKWFCDFFPVEGKPIFFPVLTLWPRL